MKGKNDEHELLHLKIIILGDAGAGKTSILKRYIENKFEPGATTIVPIVSKKILSNNGKKFSIDLWDLPGQDRNPIITRTFAKDCHGIIYCCEVNNTNSRDNLKDWEESLKSCRDIQDIPRIVIENKCDLLGDEIHFNDDINLLKKTSKELGCLNCFRTSALNGYNVENALNFLNNQIIKDFKIEGIDKNNHKKLKVKNSDGDDKSKCC